MNLAVSRVSGFRAPPLVAPAPRVVGAAAPPAADPPIDVDVLWEELASPPPRTREALEPAPPRPLALTPAAVAGAYAASRPRFVRASHVDLLVV